MEFYFNLLGDRGDAKQESDDICCCMSRGLKMSRSWLFFSAVAMPRNLIGPVIFSPVAAGKNSRSTANTG